MQGLQKALSGAMCWLTYNRNLIRNGLIAGETAFEVATALFMDTRAGARVALTTREALTNVLDVFVGGARAFGSPLEFQRITRGLVLSSGLSMVAGFLIGASEIANTSANLALTKLEWDQRHDEWSQQVDVVKIEIQQLEGQKLATDWRKAAVV